MSDSIRTALERLHQYAEIFPEHDTDAILAAAHAALAEERGEGLSNRIASIAKAVQECAFTWEPDARLVGNVCAEDIADLCSAVLARWGHQPARLRNCPTHGQQPPEAWGCPECVRELREELAAARLRQPTPPAEGDVAELVAKLRRLAPHNPLGTADPTITRAAELLQQQHPTPVPVSERLPGDQLCWWYEPDEDDGYGGRWTLLRIRGGTSAYTHWLPAHALPVPQGEVK